MKLLLNTVISRDFHLTKKYLQLVRKRNEKKIGAKGKLFFD